MLVRPTPVIFTESRQLNSFFIRFFLKYVAAAWECGTCTFTGNPISARNCIECQSGRSLVCAALPAAAPTAAPAASVAAATAPVDSNSEQVRLTCLFGRPSSDRPLIMIFFYHKHHRAFFAVALVFPVTITTTHRETRTRAPDAPVISSPRAP
jgi:hypothetical protein